MIFEATLVVMSLLWLLAAIVGVYGLESSQNLSDTKGPDPERWPKLSVVVAALNEEATIEPALRSLAACSYPNLEIIVVNDRSTDRTGAIIDAVAREHPAVRPLHIQELPAGWLGKVHALHRGTQAASGEWVLYTDADVHFEPGALEQAIRFALSERLDHLAALPYLRASTRFEQAALVSFGVALSITARPHRIGKPGSKAFLGVGAFNLVRRAKLESTPGFEWIKMEVADDSGLAQLIVENGGRSRFVRAYDLLNLEWYPSLKALVKGLEKNIYGVFAFYRAPIFVLKMCVLLPLIVAPFVAMVVGSPWVAAVGFLAICANMAVAVFGSVRSQFGVLVGLLAPFVGTGVMLWALFLSAFACWRDGGIRWRGTLYAIAELRAGQRVKLW